MCYHAEECAPGEHPYKDYCAYCEVVYCTYCNKEWRVLPKGRAQDPYAKHHCKKSKCVC